jgi:hypothetical protein
MLLDRLRSAGASSSMLLELQAASNRMLELQANTSAGTPSSVSLEDQATSAASSNRMLLEVHAAHAARTGASAASALASAASEMEHTCYSYAHATIPPDNAGVHSARRASVSRRVSVYTHTHTHMYIYIYMYGAYRERE